MLVKARSGVGWGAPIRLCRAGGRVCIRPAGRMLTRTALRAILVGDLNFGSLACNNTVGCSRHEDASLLHFLDAVPALCRQGIEGFGPISPDHDLRRVDSCWCSGYFTPVSDTPKYPGTPRWVKIVGSAALVCIVLLVVVLVAHGHGPQRHFGSLTPTLPPSTPPALAPAPDAG